MKVLSFLILVAVMGPSHATSFFRSGSDLDELAVVLAAKGHVNEAVFAKGYVTGAADATMGTTWCSSTHLAEEQVHRTVAKYMQAHPEALKQVAATVVGDALAADFPCRKK